MVVKLNKKKGFTLVELVIVIGILAVLVGVVAGILNPIALFNRARDARRKKDINSIKTAFEEYYNDKGSYPTQAKVDSLECGSTGFSPWLKSWPCDPTGQQYRILLETDESGNPVSQPKWFKVLTNLENKKDTDIPSGWYGFGSSYHIGPYTINDVNYGVSSTNARWYEYSMNSNCHYYPENHMNDECYIKNPGCVLAPGSPSTCKGGNCYAYEDCNSGCQVSCCGSSCLE